MRSNPEAHRITRMPDGEFRGRRITNVPAGYLLVIVADPCADDDLRAAIAEELVSRMPRCIRALQRRMPFGKHESRLFRRFPLKLGWIADEPGIDANINHPLRRRICHQIN